MGRPKKGTPPKYRGPHKATGGGFVQIGKTYKYFPGPHNSRESLAAYNAWLATWAAGQAKPTPIKPQPGCTVAQLVAAFLQHADGWYVREDGSPTGEADKFVLCTKPLLERWPALPVDQLTAEHLAELQAVWVKKGHARKTINQYVGRVLHVFRWGRKKKLVSPATVAELESLEPLSAGRTTAPESQGVYPPRAEDLEAARLEMSVTVRAMTQIQELVGCRPGEVCRMRRLEIDTDGRARIGKHTLQLEGWVFAPGWHKNKRRGKPLYYVLGPKARDVLRPFLEVSLEGYCFPPDRRTRSPGQRYTTASYGRAVRRACKRAGVPEWGVNQLRHLFATRADREAGLQTASAALGHSSTSTTAIYVESRLREAAQLAQRIG